MKALNLAIDGKVTEHVIPSFTKVESFLKEWNIGIVDQRKLFLAIANVLKENKRYGGSVFLLMGIDFNHQTYFWLCVFLKSFLSLKLIM